MEDGEGFLQSRVESSTGAATLRSLKALTNMVADVVLQQASFLERTADEKDLELRRLGPDIDKGGIRFLC